MYKGLSQRQYGLRVFLRTRTGEVAQRDVTLPARSRGEAIGRATTAAVTPNSTVLRVEVLA